jgi:hypothetical protein
VEFRRRDYLCQFFHVGRLDVYDVEALVLYVEVPEIDPKVVATDERLSVAVYGYAIDVVCMSVCICLTGNSGHDGVVMSKTREF